MLSFLVWVTIAPILLGSVFIHLFYKHLLFTMYKWNTYMENGNSAFKELSVQWKESKVDSRVETYIYISVYIYIYTLFFSSDILGSSLTFSVLLREETNFLGSTWS